MNLGTKLILLITFIQCCVSIPVKSKGKFRGLQENEFNEMEKCVKKLKVDIAKGMGKQLEEADITDTLFDDIAVNLEQCQYMTELQNNKKNKKGRQKRKAVNFRSRPSYEWTLPISYYVDTDDFDATIQKSIHESFELWENRTCLRFQKVNSGFSGKHIKVQGSESGCWSYVGKVSLNPQPINVQVPGCTVIIGIPIHEIGHAMGFYHEQSRPDRDEHVRILFQNIISGYSNNFDKQTASDTFNVPYDYASIMHYGRGDFSSNGQMVIESVYPEYTYTIGQSSDASFMDLTAMNRLYQCTGKNAPGSCSSPSVSCQNGGYPDPGAGSECTSCRCPAGLKGDCTQAADGSAGCTPLSGNIDVTSTTESCLTSPNYDGTSLYNIGDKCSWVLKATAGRLISLRFDKSQGFGVYYRSSRAVVCQHWVEIKHNGNLTVTGPRFCGSALLNVNQNEVILSSTEEVVIDFRSDYTLIDNTSSKMLGFKLCYKLAKEGVTTSSTTVRTTTTSTCNKGSCKQNKGKGKKGRSKISGKK